jgi:hypothetical protein
VVGEAGEAPGEAAGSVSKLTPSNSKFQCASAAVPSVTSPSVSMCSSGLTVALEVDADVRPFNISARDEMAGCVGRHSAGNVISARSCAMLKQSLRSGRHWTTPGSSHRPWSHLCAVLHISSCRELQWNCGWIH